METPTTGPGPIMTDQMLPLRTEDVLKILQTIDHDRCVSAIPFFPKGGEVYVYKPLPREHRLWWRDGYVWKNQGVSRLPRKKPTIEKRYYHAVLQGGETDLTICRHCYCQDPKYDPDCLTLVHYIGNLGHEENLARESVIENGDVNDGATEIQLEEASTTVTTDEGEITLFVQEPSSVLMVESGDNMAVPQETREACAAIETMIVDLGTPTMDALPTQIVIDATPLATTPDLMAASSPATTPDLTVAMETMKAALEANKADKPMMEMFSKLMESVTSAKSEVEYTLVVSDKNSGESSLFGSQEGKEIVSQSPQILTRLGKRRRSGELSTSKVIDDEEPLPKITRSRMREKAPDKPDSNVGVKKRGRPRLSKSVSENRQTEQVSCVTDCSAPTEQMNNISGQHKSIDRKNKTPSTTVAIEGVKSPEKNSRSSIRTRKVDSPNWRDILSGRKSFDKTQDSIKPNKISGKKLLLDDNVNYTHLDDDLFNEYGLLDFSIKLETIDEGYNFGLEPDGEGHSKDSVKKTADQESNSAELSEHGESSQKRRCMSPRYSMGENENGTPNKGKGKIKGTPAASNGQGSQNHLGNKTLKHGANKKKTDGNPIQTVDDTNNSSRRSQRRISHTRKYEEFQMDTPLIRHSQSNDLDTKSLHTKVDESGRNISKTKARTSSNKAVASLKNLPQKQRKSSPGTTFRLDIKCEVPSCGRKFSQMYRLHQHMWLDHPDCASNTNPMKKDGRGRKPKSKAGQQGGKIAEYDKQMEMFDALEEIGSIGDGSDFDENDSDWNVELDSQQSANQGGSGETQNTEVEDKAGIVKKPGTGKTNLKKHGTRKSGFVKKEAKAPKCLLCGLIYTDRRDMEQHVLLIHKQQLSDIESAQLSKKEENMGFECWECSTRFNTSSDLSYHKRVLHKVDYGSFMYFGFVAENDRYCCEICQADFDSMDNYLDHRSDHLKFPFLCRLCGYGFNDAELYAEHTQSDCKVKSLHLGCGMCEQKFQSCDTRRKHIYAIHERTTDFVCHHCGLCFDIMDELKEHFPTHIKDKIFKCEFCDKSFLEKRRLIDHRSRHRATKSVLCPVCYKYFSNEKSMERHRKSHCKNMFECLHCHKKFAFQEALIDHEEIHIRDEMDGKESDNCDVSGKLLPAADLQEKKDHDCQFCDLTFLSATELARHRKSAHPTAESPEQSAVEIKKIGDMWNCGACGFSTLFKGRLKRHMEIHEVNKQFKCDFCRKKFQTYSSLSTHRIVHRSRIGNNKGRSFPCRWANCKHAFTKRAKLKRHMASHLFRLKKGFDNCDCKDCSTTTSETVVTVVGSEIVLGEIVESINNDNAVRHAFTEPGSGQHIVRNNEEDVSLMKPINSEPQSASLEILQSAISQIEHIEDQTKLEGDCRSSQNDILWHGDSNSLDTTTKGTKTEVDEMTEKTNDKTESNPVIPKIGQDSGDGIYFECALCDKRFPTKCKVLEHNNTDHADHSYPTCDVCHKTFLDPKNLIEHKSVHTGAKPWVCKDCGKTFRIKTSWRQHCYIHAKIKPYYCSICGHGFTQKGYFDQHVKRHTGDLPFECEICHKRFVTKDCRKRHMYAHTGKKPRVCDECGKSFVDITALKIHQRTHKNERPFTCERCDKSFYENAKLTRHLKTVHGLNLTMISDYFSTKCGAGVGWRRRSKHLISDQDEQATQIVYIDKHGKVLNTVENQDHGAEQTTVDDSTVNREESCDGNEQTVAAASQTTDDSVSDNDNTSTFVTTETGLKRITRPNADGQLKVEASSVPGDASTQVIIPAANPNVPVSNMQIIDGNMVQNHNCVEMSVVDEVTSNTQHLEILSQALASHGVSTGQVQVADGVKVEQFQEQDDGTVRIYAQQDGAATENFSINIGEDGTVDAADIEALRNMYSDQPIVIVLESQPQ